MVRVKVSVYSLQHRVEVTYFHWSCTLQVSAAGPFSKLLLCSNKTINPGKVNGWTTTPEQQNQGYST